MRIPLPLPLMLTFLHSSVHLVHALGDSPLRLDRVNIGEKMPDGRLSIPRRRLRKSHLLHHGIPLLPILAAAFRFLKLFGFRSDAVSRLLREAFVPRRCANSRDYLLPSRLGLVALPRAGRASSRRNGVYSVSLVGDSRTSSCSWRFQFVYAVRCGSLDVVSFCRLCFVSRNSALLRIHTLQIGMLGYFPSAASCDRCFLFLLRCCTMAAVWS